MKRHPPQPSDGVSRWCSIPHSHAAPGEGSTTRGRNTDQAVPQTIIFPGKKRKKRGKRTQLFSVGDSIKQSRAFSAQIFLFLHLQVELMSATKSARSSRRWGRRTSEPCRYSAPYLPSRDTQHLSQDQKKTPKKPKLNQNNLRKGKI